MATLTKLSVNGTIKKYTISCTKSSPVRAVGKTIAKPINIVSPVYLAILPNSKTQLKIETEPVPNMTKRAKLMESKA